MWTKHILGPKKLPQKCVRCGVTLIEDQKNDDTGAQVADPLDREGEAIYALSGSEDPKEDGHITTALPAGTAFTECTKS
jgi:hypothetical protein